MTFSEENEAKLISISAFAETLPGYVQMLFSSLRILEITLEGHIDFVSFHMFWLKHLNVSETEDSLVHN